MPNANTTPKTKSDTLLAVLANFAQVLIVTHDNPDPDAIASGWGLYVLIDDVLKKPVRIIGGGAIVRAENREMLKLLQPPIELVEDIDVPSNVATILVDCGLGKTNHLLTRKGIQPVAVIDHHTENVESISVPFRDIRPEVAASASIVASYLCEQQIDPGVKLATAMLYAIRTETLAYETHHSRLDRKILPWLMERAEPELLAEIQNAPLTRSYFGDLMLALQSARIYDDAALCFLPRASGPEIVGEVADLLVRAEGIRRVLCAAIVGNDLLLSARSARNSGSAAKLLSATLDGLGGCGGHLHRAGGKITGVAHDAKLAENLHDELRDRWLAACGVARQRGSRLVAKKDIIQHL